MVRLPRPLLLLALALCACALPACARHTVASLSLHYLNCSNGCFWVDLSASRAGAVSIDPTFPGLPLAPMRREQIASVLDEAPLDALARCTSSPVVSNTDELTVVATLDDGSTVRCEIPASFTRNRSESDSRILQYYGELDRMLMAPLLGPQMTAFKAAVNGPQLQAVHLVRGPCYGTCPFYTVTFHRNDAAVLLWENGSCKVRSTGIVPFERVRAALLAANIGFSEARYPRVWTDSASAALSFETPRYTFRIEGPDSMTWGREFSAAITRLDQVVLDTDWRPRLPPRRIDGSLPLRDSNRC